MDKNRVFLIVLDSFGIGNAPDADMFDDTGSNTLQTLHQSGRLNIPNLKKLGLGHIDDVNIDSHANPIGQYGRLVEYSVSKDTTTGHWEMMGIISNKKWPTFPHGFDKEFIDGLKKITDRPILCNKPYSGTEVLKDYGQEAVDKQGIILYTSADSVVQIAAHTDVVRYNELIDICKKTRELSNKYGIGRVIARPFNGRAPYFERDNARRKDFAMNPPFNYLNELYNKNKNVVAIGKIGDIFNMSGITRAIHTDNNGQGMAVTELMLNEDFDLCFTNLVDFDMLYGHRRDTYGYVQAMNEFDKWLGNFITKLKDNDTLIITADHGCDPAYKGSDHTRECTPVLIYHKNILPHNLGTMVGFDNIMKYCKSFLD